MTDENDRNNNKNNKNNPIFFFFFELCREARNLFHGSRNPSVPSGCRRLEDIVSEYIALKNQDEQRRNYGANNPLARSMYFLLDSNAAVDISRNISFQHGPSANVGLIPVASLGNHEASHAQPHQPHAIHPSNVAMPGHQQSQPLTSPKRHAQRKNPPKKRTRMNTTAGRADSQSAHGVSESYLLTPGNSLDSLDGNMINLLNKQMNIEGLEMLLDDAAIQQNFAEPIAEHINRFISDSTTEHNSVSKNGHHNLNTEEWLPPLIEDPRLADLFGQLTRDEGHQLGKTNKEGNIAPQHELQALQKNDDAFQKVDSRKSEIGRDLPKGIRKYPTTLSEAFDEYRRNEEAKTNANSKNNSVDDRRKLDTDFSDNDIVLKNKDPNQTKVEALVDRNSKENPGANRAFPEHIAEYLSRPEDFEDIINECVG